MSKRKRKQQQHPRKLELARTQKKRQWEFLTLRNHRDAAMNLLSLAQIREDWEEVARLRSELEAIELRGAEILKEQKQFLSR